MTLQREDEGSVMRNPGWYTRRAHLHRSSHLHLGETVMAALPSSLPSAPTSPMSCPCCSPTAPTPTSQPIRARHRCTVRRLRREVSSSRLYLKHVQIRMHSTRQAPRRSTRQPWLAHLKYACDVRAYRCQSQREGTSAVLVLQAHQGGNVGRGSRFAMPYSIA